VTTRLSLAEDLEAPVEQGQTLGTLEVYVGDELRDTVPILAAQPVERLSIPGIFGRMLSKLLMAG
jgi:D-alanyl-D-alanine carboxypeptidase (penicillin-binding protein 5/6)